MLLWVPVKVGGYNNVHLTDKTILANYLDTLIEQIINCYCHILSLLVDNIANKHVSRGVDITITKKDA